MIHTDFDYHFKLLIIGDSGVGKTSLLLRFIEDSFTSNHLTTIGIDFKTKMVKMKNSIIKLQIWDSAGQDRFKTITNSYYKGANGIILAYDVTDENSFHSIKNWLRQIEENTTKDIIKVLVGNKCDKDDRKISFEEGEKLAEKSCISFFESSAKTNHYVNEIFIYFAQELLNEIERKCKENNLIIHKKTQKEQENVKPSSCCR